ncbi:MAG: UDP-N-acetylmuramate dehydrogenase [Parcubacteria group bacterium Gr01-1014_8]|nr:MAG: UDP-N-acetylmuramate dehydrogenase [Parcubacteria group bacterium Gr01-1014_8]
MLTIKENVPLAELSTFEIGGKARYFVSVKTEEDIKEALGWAREHGHRFIVMAGGSNVVVPDEGLDALIIKISGVNFSIIDSTIEIDAGCVLLHVIKAAADEGLGGWEKLAGIPGTVGGAVRGNAGAFGNEIKDVITWVRAINTKTGEGHEFANPECEFAYRMSYFKKNPEWIITRVHISLQKTDAIESQRLITETIKERERRHIQDVRAAGSYFINPVAPTDIREMYEKEKKAQSREGRVPAGWLIEKAGLKGRRVGGAEASMQHPNYIVNTGNATASDVRRLAELIKRIVKEKFGVELQEEAVVWK